MSTATSALPGQQITGNEQVDIDSLVKSEVERLWANQKTQLQTQNAGIPSEQATPIKLNVFGQEFTFNDPASASAAVEQALQQVRDQVATQSQALQQQPHVLPTEAPQNHKAFDKAKFADIVSEDPLKGIDYALGHLLFNGEVESAATILKGQLGASAQQRQVMAAYQFRERFPGFTPDNQSVAALDQIRQGLGLNADNAESWEASYALGVARGIFRPPAPQQPQINQPQQQQYMQPVPGYNTQRQPYIPPVFGRGQSNEAPPDWIRKAEEMKTEDLEKILMQFNR